MSMLVAWIPFVGPMPSMGPWWPLLMLPLVLGVSMIYKALRVEKLAEWPREVLLMSAQIVGALVLLAIGLTIVVQWIIPAIPVN